ncbi:DUF2796 domain-containing protein [Roseovarius aestuarii]|nr:DUF2796 domain-containing protein [Roseovarius aestuarii]
MRALQLTLLASVMAAPLSAQETRELDAHVHGVSTLELAIEDGIVEMSLMSPGMDIVGFEYSASTAADKDAVESALRKLTVPENVVTLPEAAECRLAEVLVHVHSEDHEGHDEDETHGHGDHEKEAHGHDEHEHEDHNDDAHEHDKQEHDDHDDDAHEHAEHGQHNEFHVRYKFACDHSDDLSAITFPFFAQFEHAQEIEAQYVTETGSGLAEIERDAPQLSLE